MLRKVSELTGPALDWAVAKCEGAFIDTLDDTQGPWVDGPTYVGDLSGYNPTANWSQGGPIIDRIEGFHLKVWLKSNREGKCQVEIHNCDGDWIQFGPTTLIAAMRCYVASKLGDEIDTPEELTTN